MVVNQVKGWINICLGQWRLAKYLVLFAFIVFLFVDFSGQMQSI